MFYCRMCNVWLLRREDEVFFSLILRFFLKFIEIEVELIQFILQLQQVYCLIKLFLKKVNSSNILLHDKIKTTSLADIRQQIIVIILFCSATFLNNFFIYFFILLDNRHGELQFTKDFSSNHNIFCLVLQFLKNIIKLFVAIDIAYIFAVYLFESGFFVNYRILMLEDVVCLVDNKSIIWRNIFKESFFFLQTFNMGGFGDNLFIIHL